MYVVMASLLSNTVTDSFLNRNIVLLHFAQVPSTEVPISIIDTVIVIEVCLLAYL